VKITTQWTPLLRVVKMLAFENMHSVALRQMNFSIAFMQKNREKLKYKTILTD